MAVLIGIGAFVVFVAYIFFMIWLVTRNMQASFLMISLLRLVVGSIIAVGIGFGLLPAAAGLPVGLLIALGVWYGVAFVRARLGKWNGLAKRYHRDGFQGAQWKFKTGLLGTADPRGLGHPLIAMQSWLILGTDRGGLYLSHHFIGKPFHPAMYIPWDAITVNRPEHVFGWFKKLYLDLYLGPEKIVLRLDRKFATQLLKQYGPAVPPLVAQQAVAAATGNPRAA